MSSCLHQLVVKKQAIKSKHQTPYLPYCVNMPQHNLQPSTLINRPHHPKNVHNTFAFNTIRECARPNNFITILNISYSKFILKTQT